MKKYLVALDQGTTSSRAIVFDRSQQIVASAQKEFPQLYPQAGWVEHDPLELYSSQYGVMMEAITRGGIDPAEIAAIGITNQRETTIVWEKATGQPHLPRHRLAVPPHGRPVRPAARRRADGAHSRPSRALCRTPISRLQKFGGFSTMCPVRRSAPSGGELLFGTVDSWLVWKLTARPRPRHGRARTPRAPCSLTSTASTGTRRSCSVLRIPRCDAAGRAARAAATIGTCNIQGVEIPIAGAAGDQQAALFGQCCFAPGEAKNTYGTGCFLLMNTGETPCVSRHGLVTTIAAGLGGHVTYALEGSVFVGGAVIQWLRDEMRFLSEASDAEYYAQKVPSTGGVYFVPAFTGLGAPYWDMYARGAIVGITRGTKREHIIRAAQESIAYQSMDLVAAMEKDTGVPLRELRVDGGASRDAFLMQFQADMLATPVRRPVIRETTALGAAYLAGLAVGIWHDPDELRRQWRCDVSFLPHMTAEQREKNRRGWAKAVGRSLDWAKEE